MLLEAGSHLRVTEARMALATPLLVKTARPRALVTGTS